MYWPGSRAQPPRSAPAGHFDTAHPTETRTRIYLPTVNAYTHYAYTNLFTHGKRVYALRVHKFYLPMVNAYTHYAELCYYSTLFFYSVTGMGVKNVTLTIEQQLNNHSRNNPSKSCTLSVKREKSEFVNLAMCTEKSGSISMWSYCSRMKRCKHGKNQ